MLDNKYILVADGGSTKVDWALLQPNNEHQIFHTTGLNPFVLDIEGIQKTLKSGLLPQITNYHDSISHIYFYGAGCSSLANQNIIHSALQLFFPDAEINVDHDLYGAVLALCGDDAGIVGILGTGSNCCIYDGKEIISKLTCLGYLAGDEGSGNYMGKLVLQSFCYHTMPEHIRKAFVKYYNKTRQQIIAELYAAEKPNAYLASYTQFLSQVKDDPYGLQIIRQAFRDYIEKNVLTQNIPQGYPFNFTGSIAYHFQDILKTVLLENGLSIGKIIQKPIEGMIDYHSSKR